MAPRILCPVKPRKSELKIVTKTGFYRQATAQCSMLALQNAHIGAFCNASMMHVEKTPKNTVSVFRGLTVYTCFLTDVNATGHVMTAHSTATDIF